MLKALVGAASRPAPEDFRLGSPDLRRFWRRLLAPGRSRHKLSWRDLHKPILHLTLESELDGSYRTLLGEGYDVFVRV